MSNNTNTDAKNNKSVDTVNAFYFSANIADITLPAFREYCIHIFCTAGKAEFSLGDKKLEMYKCSCLVLLNNSLIKFSKISHDFNIKAIFISNKYLDATAPDTNYNSIGILSLMDAPLVAMSEQEFKLCLSVVDAIHQRLSMTEHIFYRGVLRRAVETLLLDIYNIHSRRIQKINGKGSQGIMLFRQFISMLEDGNYRQYREVKWYAGHLNISSKYLSEISTDISGHGASYWINRFAVEEIARLLHNPALSINSIAEIMHFATRSYFSHYVKERLGMPPKDYRLMVLGVKK